MSLPPFAIYLSLLQEIITRPPAPRVARQSQASKTHCPHGHIFDELNTYRGPDGKRDCRACSRARSRRAHQKRTEV